MKINNVVIAVPTYGNFLFNKMTFEHIKKTTKSTKYKLYVVVGKEDDKETIHYLRENSIHHTIHETNKGLPASINDIYDYSFKILNSDAIIVVGNDVLPYWGAIDKLVEISNSTDYSWISGVAVSISQFIKAVPKCASYFGGGEKDKNFNKEELSEWLSEFKPKESDKEIMDLSKHKIIGDSHNMCLFTKELFNKIGYIDVNFFPAYFEDNDYSRRAQLSDIKMCRVSNSRYFHFWSRTLHQGGQKSFNDKYFPMNKEYYIQKWNGVPGHEVWDRPFNGKPSKVNGIKVGSSMNIQSRAKEELLIESWKQR